MVTWICDAREHGLPVMVTGVAVLLELGWPLSGAALAVGLLMVVSLLMGAAATFTASDGGPGDG